MSIHPSPRRFRWPVVVLLVGFVSLLASGCVVPEGGYGYHGNRGYDLGYYGRSGAIYGGWGRGYNVGPVQHGVGYEQYRGHGPPVSRPVPPIPWHERPGGGN